LKSLQYDEDDLPSEAVDRLTRPLARFLKIQSAAGATLLVAAAAALILSNSSLSEAFTALWDSPVGVQAGTVEFTRPLRDWINDGLMTLFFFVMSLELKREFVHGELRDYRMVALSLAGAVGGMIVPAAIYVALMQGHAGVRGWGMVTASDTAFVVATLALLGNRLPGSLRLFLLSLSVFDDIGAVFVVVVGYGDALYLPALVAASVLGVAVLSAARSGVRSVRVYAALGLGLWLALDVSGIHPTLAGVILGLITPAREWVSDERLRAIFERVLSYPRGRHWSGDTTDRADLRRAGVAAVEALSPAERLEMAIHPWSAFLIMPLFALANAGVAVSWTGFASPVTAATFLSLVIGKPLGVLALSWLAVRTGFATRPAGLSWPLMAAGCLLTGIGFTMSLFVAEMAFEATSLGPAKIGILLASLTSSLAGFLALSWLTRRTGAASPTDAVAVRPA
jgi:Na+:H+ antiporter, NhaA family